MAETELVGALRRKSSSRTAKTNNIGAIPYTTLCDRVASSKQILLLEYRAVVGAGSTSRCVPCCTGGAGEAYGRSNAIAETLPKNLEAAQK
jgi:hypothetical protein